MFINVANNVRKVTYPAALVFPLGEGEGRKGVHLQNVKNKLEKNTF